MTVRLRVQAAIAVVVALLLASALATISPVQSASASTSAAAAANSAKADAGAKAGRKAGASAGAKAGRRAAAKAGPAAALAGEKAGRKAGGAAGAKAGRKAGARGGAKAGARAGAKAGAKAGAAAGARVAAATMSACGASRYLKPDGTPWVCTFGDDFSGTRLNTSKWRVMTSADFNFGKRPDCFLDNAKNVSVASGYLTLTSRKETSSFSCPRGKSKVRTQYSAGMVSTYEKWTQAYGRFEFRAKFPYAIQRGLQTSAWLWPQGSNGSSWPASGEIDVAEWYSQFPDRVIPYLHYSTLVAGSPQATNNQCLVDRVQDWHTYLLEWSPGSIRISYDGTMCMVNNSTGAPFNKPYMMSMFQGFGLKRNAPNSTTPKVAHAEFDWVRVWS